jgi:hypothetical protein
MPLLYNTVKCQLCRAARAVDSAELNSEVLESLATDQLLYDIAGPTLAKVVGSRPTLAIVVGFKSIRNLEASYLIKYIKLQLVTRQAAKKAAKVEEPLVQEILLSLVDLIRTSQGIDPLCIKLKKELAKVDSN